MSEEKSITLVGGLSGEDQEKIKIALLVARMTGATMKPVFISSEANVTLKSVIMWMPNREGETHPQQP